MTDKYEEVWYGTRSEIKTINGKKELFYERNYSKIGVNTDDDLSLNKSIQFRILAMIITCVFHKDEKLNPQIYEDECLYEL